ncbi:hypothetical protein BGZ92_010504 [Podila epicladia]|nr:hypothetical protein BGZ92_010504 [Podila epicladia]
MPSIIESVPKPMLASEMCSGTTAHGPLPVSSGWASIDRILGGQGWLAGQVNEICGASGCGKTQMCLVSAVKLLLDHNSSRVIWIETSDGNFSAERAYSAAKAQSKKQSSETVNADQGSLDIELTTVAVQNGPEDQSPSILLSSVLKPGLGTSWRFATDLQLFVSRMETPPSQWSHSMQSLEPTPSQQTARLVEIMRSKRQKIGEWTVFNIKQ